MSKWSEKNRCDHCGKFKPWSKLRTYGADDGDTSVDGLECTDCFPPEPKGQKE